MIKPVEMNVMSIVHGKSEYRICSSMKSNLRLKHEIIARDKGKNSIQVTSVMGILQDRRFATYRDFIRTFDDVARGRGKLQDFSLFIIMDVDDCTEDQKCSFISKEMFRKHWLYEFIKPIYNSPNLEATMKEAGIEISRKEDYFTIFPTSHGDLDINIAEEYLNKFRKCKSTNLDEYIDYCLAIARKRL